MRSSKVNTGDSGLASQYNNLRSDAYGGSQLLVHQQATPGLTLYVEPGVYRIGANRYIFAGGNTPSFTAPSSNPRIDIVTIDSTSTVAITQGTENASPVAPAYPLNKLVLAEIYNRVGETALYDTDPGGSNGYVYNDVRPFLGGAYISSDSQVAAGANIDPAKLNAGNVDADWLPDADNTRKLGSSSRRWSEIRAAFLYGDGSNLTGLSAISFVKSYTAGEAIDASSTPQAVYMKASDGKVYKSITTGDESSYKFVGFVANAQNVSSGASVNVTQQGIVTGFSSLTQNGFYYITSTAGTISTTPDGTRPVRVAFALSTSSIFIIYGQKIRTVSDGIGSGTGAVTHTITVGFRVRLVLGTCEGGNGGGTTGTSSFFVSNELGQYCLISRGPGGVQGTYGDRIGMECDANPSFWSINLNTITETGFNIVFNRGGTWAVGGSFQGIAFGE